MVNGQTVWTIGIPVHWGFVGITRGSMANLLTPYVGDANTRCPEFKAFLVNVERAEPSRPRVPEPSCRIPSRSNGSRPHRAP